MRPEMDDGIEATTPLVTRPNRPTALLVINDLLAIAALRSAADLGLRIPNDVSVASFDNIQFASFSIPRLTTVSGNAENWAAVPCACFSSVSKSRVARRKSSMRYGPDHS